VVLTLKRILVKVYECEIEASGSGSCPVVMFYDTAPNFLVLLPEN